MFSTESLIYPIIGVAIVLLAATLIRKGFKQEFQLNDHRRKSIKHDNKLRARYSGSRSWIVIVAFMALLFYASWQIWNTTHGYTFEHKPFYIFFGVAFLAQLLLAAFSKPYELKHVTDTTKDFSTAILVPVYNESETSLRECLESFFYQTVLPTEIYVVDDGSKHNYSKTKKWFLKEGRKKGVKVSWQRQDNAGKRKAHSKALDNISTDINNKIIVTVDSDGVLDPHALEEGLKPFIDPRVMSVAGIVIAKNAQTNFLSRITDLIFVSSQQLIDRSAMSQFGSVLVNSGGLAFYRGPAIQLALENGYTNEMFFNREVHFSDDSYLTLFALLEGRAVQQQSSIVFADMPVTLSHHFRQQLRWGRGSFIRSWWRLRFLSINSIAYIRQIIGWAIFVSISIILIQLFIINPAIGKELPPPALLLIPFVFGLLQSSRYFSIKRSDMSTMNQLLIFMLSPFATLWSSLVLRSIRLYAMATCHKTRWGTRMNTEILHPSDEHA